MTINADRDPVLLDTSAAVALLVADHAHHDTTFDSLADGVLGLAGHAAFETFSVLTRLPPPNRLAETAVTRLLLANFPETRFLDAGRAAELFRELAGHRLAGGAVYDALVAATAREHGLTLVSRDQRALNTYRRIGVDLHLLP